MFESSSLCDDHSELSNSLAIGWNNLNYSKYGIISRHAKPILKNLNGRINFGTLNALMGPSGAGKTTLLRCINQRKSNGLSDDSKIYVNKWITVKSRFISQDTKEHLLMGLTGRESLMYASKICNSRQMKGKNRLKEISTQTGRSLLSVELSVESSNSSSSSSYRYQHIDTDDHSDHQKNVSKIIMELMLEECADTMVNNLSGGEQKRLAVALELVAQEKPNLLCIDEPTSGLDSNAAEKVIECLKHVTRKHSIATVTSIHQPNSLILALFDQLYVLANGHCIYSGHPNQLKNRLLQCNVNCPDDQLPIEILLKYASNNHSLECNDNSLALNIPKIKIESPEDTPTNVTTDDEYITLLNANRESLSNMNNNQNDGKILVYSMIERQLFSFNHFYHLLNRCVTSFVRYHWKINAVLGLFMIIVALALSNLYGKVGDDDGCIPESFFTNVTHANGQTQCPDTLSILTENSNIGLNLKCQFFANTFLLFVTMSCTVLTFPSEVKIFITEHKNGRYSTGSYYWAKIFIDFPIIIVLSYVYSLLIYYGTGQITSDLNFYINHRFADYTLIYMMGMTIANGFGSFIGILSVNNSQIAICSAVAVFLFLTLLSGFFVPLTNLHSFIQSLSYASFVKLTFESIIIALFGFKRCGDGQMSMLMHQFSLKDNQLNVNLLWLCGHIIVWRLLGLLALMFRVNSFPITLKRNSRRKLKRLRPSNITMVKKYLQTKDASNSNANVSLESVAIGESN